MPPAFLSSLSARFLLALGGVLLLAMLALALISLHVIRPALLEEEAGEASAILERIERAIENNKAFLLAQARDWANWDDTYAFIQGLQPSYESVNFSRDMFEDMHYQLMAFFNVEGELHWVAGIDPIADTYAACADLEDECHWATGYVTRLLPLLDATSEDQVLLLNEPAPAVIAISPILRTDRSGPAQGWLVKIRSIDARFIDQLEQQTGQSLQITAAVSTEDTTLKTSLTRESTRLIASRRLESPEAGQPLEIVTHIPRDGFRSSTATFRYAIGWTAGLLLLVIGVVLLLLERMVLAPLRRFSRFTQQLHQAQGVMDVPAALLERNDEIGTLAREFQTLLNLQQQRTASLIDMSHHDPLTGVANRRLFDERFARVLRRPGSHPRAAAMMIDIDHFKLYNDHYGHQAGDACLISLAQRMEQRLGALGFLLARTGGEEFSVLLPNTSLPHAIEHAQALLKDIGELALPHASSPTSTHVTVSIGIAVQQAGLVSPSDIMRAADQALYQAKAGGRNRVEVYSRTEPEPEVLPQASQPIQPES